METPLTGQSGRSSVSSVLVEEKDRSQVSYHVVTMLEPLFLILETKKKKR